MGFHKTFSQRVMGWVKMQGVLLAASLRDQEQKGKERDEK